MEYLKAFATLGTRFLRSPDSLQRQLGNIRALVFDWDGVFNSGWKDIDGGSPFSEVDSMGVNLMRFAMWQREQKLLPTAIISGQHNPYALRFAQREKLDGLYMGYSNKPEAFDAFLAAHGLEARQVAFFFDDVLDLPVARQCGLRVLIKRRSSPLLENFIVSKNDADLLTHFSGGEHGLREACELIVGLCGRPEETLEHRIRFSELYQAYLKDRADVELEIVTQPR
jgi:3-deoxy-D-manno-octulosonate 8-phosphate phosphatase (KDO 8-P phosphatase)